MWSYKDSSTFGEDVVSYLFPTKNTTLLLSKKMLTLAKIGFSSIMGRLAKLVKL